MRVPQYQPQIAPQASPGESVREANLQPIQQGHQRLAQSLDNLGKGAYKAYMKAQDDARRTEVSERLSELDRKRSEILYRQQDGVFATRGKNAISMVKMFNKEFAGARADIAKKFTDKQARAMFDERSLSIGDTFDRQVRNHSANEYKTYQSDVFNSEVQRHTDQAAEGFDDPVLVNKALTGVEEDASRRAKQLGLDGKQTEQLKGDTYAQVLSSAIGGMITNGHDYKAKVLWGKVKSSKKGKIIPSTKKNEIDRLVRAGTVKGEAMRLVDGLMAKGLPLGEALAKVREHKDPDVRTLGVRMTKERYHEMNTIEQVRQDNLVNKFINNFDVNNNFEPDTKEFATLDHQRKTAYNNYVHKKRTGKITTSDATVYDMLNRLASGTPAERQKFAGAGYLLQFLDKLTMKDWKKFQADAAEIRKAGGASPKGLRTRRELIDHRLDEMGITAINRKQKSHLEWRAGVDRELEARMINYMKEKKVAEVPQEILTRWIDELTTEVVTSESWLPFGIGDERKSVANVTWADVPSDLVPQYVDKLREYNNRVPPAKRKPVTRPYILELYKTELLKKQREK